MAAIKIVLAGNFGVGKSNLLSRYLNNEFSLESRNTSGLDCYKKQVQIGEKAVNVEIWDTGNIERERDREIKRI
jgi:Ras-related protein Rab-11A